MPQDLRTKRLAKKIVEHSVFVKSGETVTISGNEESIPFIKELYKQVILKGAYPILNIKPSGIADFFFRNAKKHQIEKFPEISEYIAKKSDKWIGIHSESNTRELSNCPSEKISLRQKITHPISNYICNSKPNIYRCTVGFPSQALAQEAEMSLDEYEDFFYKTCLQDWEKISKKLKKISNKFKKNSLVRIIGKNVDLSFRVHGDKSILDDAKENMPGGEVFMAPVKESIDGWIKFEYPAIRSGKEVTDVFLKFEKGKIIDFDASKNKPFLESALKTDKNESSKYIGEFGIGCNPKINKFTKNLLFDEKINGTIHLAIGATYNENTEGLQEKEKNKSNIHWDIVKDLSKSKMIVDNKIIQENGKWKIKGVNF